MSGELASRERKPVCEGADVPEAQVAPEAQAGITYLTLHSLAALLSQASAPSQHGEDKTEFQVGRVFFSLQKSHCRHQSKCLPPLVEGKREKKKDRGEYISSLITFINKIASFKRPYPS